MEKQEMSNETKQRWTSGTLEEFVDYHGTQKAAAAIIGVHEGTLNRWINKHESPRGMTIDRLKQLRIKTGERKKWEGGTLRKFVKHMGTQRAAANEIGIREDGLNRILNGHAKPRGMTLHRLKQLKISVGR